ncbi:3-methyl-2-oxobutanoate hydroxymethyltransferase [Marinihelvus fidelis]|uniref:3-methyl-2-oxobutanoate hydroxymethyltransferase n=1 Tax=Marinihelvus fidelis TaxID=2613842 RepID=A0A5N0TD98_9GAMM|nr:3-methyl-2-oxobutanoate hydroxymethyltransferase [Marinihelvus fidelis]KAA9132047.1 3-methyl-2-oxobutanoate hydroxymethyltransferase [Marinihelvus fidelis]
MNILNFPERKKGREAIVMVTCYDYTMARIVADSAIDMILVGDSAAMVMHGHDTTLPISVDEMAMHVRAVRRGAPETFVVADLPFLATRKGLEAAMDAVEAVMKAGASAVKIEGIEGQADLVRHIVASGVPVMGHLGLTPQAVNQLGGFRVQGRSEDDRARLMREARECQAAGCFALVLECVPESLAEAITRSLDIVTIGIGAGDRTDGQVLVMHDLLGLTDGFKPKFVRQYMDGRAQVCQALDQYASDVRERAFPAPEERYAG